MKGRLTRKKIGVITSLIAAWTGKLTWEALIEALRGQVGRYSRQALSRHEAIQSAYTQRKHELRASESDIGTTTEVRDLIRQRDKAVAEIAEIKAANAVLVQRFRLWSYNASLRGIFEADLDRPAPPINRH